VWEITFGIGACFVLSRRSGKSKVELENEKSGREYTEHM